MSRVVYVRYLKPKDARAIVRLKRKVYPAKQHDGRRETASRFKETGSDDSNLSIGLFDGSRLVGFILCFVRTERPPVFEDVEAPCGGTGDPRGQCIWVEDVVVLPQYSRNNLLLYRNWARELRRKGHGLSVKAFCESDQLEHWTKNERAFEHLGLAFDHTSKVRDLSHERQWHLLSWRQVPKFEPKSRGPWEPGRPLRGADLPDDFSARIIQTESDWEALRERWDELVDSISLASCFLSFDFLYTWWQHFGLSRRLSIITLYHGTHIIAIAPMMIAPKLILGTYKTRMEFIGDEVHMESPDFIVDDSHVANRELLWRCVLSTDSEWDAAYFREQRCAARRHPVPGLVDSSRYFVAMSEFSESPYVMLDQSWADYLASRSKSQRKGLGRKLRQLDAAGAWRFDVHESDCAPLGCLDTYCEIESRSWKGQSQFSVGENPARIAFYRGLLKRLDLAGKIRFRFLALDEKPIAATFGVFQKGHFASLEICHDQAFDQLSPGFVLTGLELEYCHDSTDYEEYDFLIGTYNNKRSWKTAMHRASSIYVLPRNIWGRANRLLIFSFKPRFERLLARLNLMDAFEELLSKIQARVR